MRRVKIVVLSVALTLLPASLAAAKPKPVAFDDALVKAVRDGCLPLISGEMAFIAANGEELRAKGLTLPNTIPEYLRAFSQSPWQILVEETTGKEVWLIGNAPSLQCNILVEGDTTKAHQHLLEYLAQQGSYWRPIREDTYIRGEARKDSFKALGHGGQYLLFYMVSFTGPSRPG